MYVPPPQLYEWLFILLIGEALWCENHLQTRVFLSVNPRLRYSRTSSNLAVWREPCTYRRWVTECDTKAQRFQAVHVKLCKLFHPPREKSELNLPADFLDGGKNSNFPPFFSIWPFAKFILWTCQAAVIRAYCFPSLRIITQGQILLGFFSSLLLNHI